MLNSESSPRSSQGSDGEDMLGKDKEDTEDKSTYVPGISRPNYCIENIA